jgi:hypothetical protein
MTWKPNVVDCSVAQPRLQEETPAMPSADQSAFALKPLLEECGYTGSRLKENFNFGSMTIPLAGFATKPWDFDSACIAVVGADGDSEAAAQKCREMGAPIVWVRQNGTVDWWTQHDSGPTLFKSEPVREFKALVRQHRKELGPVSVYRGKTIARVDKAKQLDFVDIGLLPLLREEAGKMLHDLVEEMTREMLARLGSQNPSRDTLRKVFTSVFRLLGGKILRDKGVHGFKRLDLSDPISVLDAVRKHYRADTEEASFSGRMERALVSASALISEAGSFDVVSPETLAYVYERALVTKSLRKKLGIHATPPFLVDYIVWRLYDWIREIPEEDRHVFEPACGHAPFLLSAMRLLRLEIQDRDEAEIHNYLKAHIHGLEKDPFACEIARLSLTLADIPNPNGWDLHEGDMFVSDSLKRQAARCRILLCNPPFEPFDSEDKQDYSKEGEVISSLTKATEMLMRSLPHMRSGAAFGVVLPQGVLHGKESKPVRERLLESFELSEIDVFADNLFEQGNHEVAVIIGRRKGSSRKPFSLDYRRVRESGMEAFKSRLTFSSEQGIFSTRFSMDTALDFRVPELDEVWFYLSPAPKIEEIASVAQGLAHKSRTLPKGSWTIRDESYPAGVHGFANVQSNLNIYGLPKLVKLNLDPRVVQCFRGGKPTGKPQVLLNYARVSRKPWKLKAILDEKGHAITSRFLSIRPIPLGPSPLVLWAILNSPVANAFAYCFLAKRDILAGTMRKLPIPSQWESNTAKIEQAALRYFQLVSSGGPLFNTLSTEEGIRQALLSMDAAVLNAYDLPPRLERQLLDLFEGVERKGVGCDFRGYYPPGFTSCLPLHMVLSDRFEKAAADSTADRFKPGESKYVREVLNAGMTSFGD